MKTDFSDAIANTEKILSRPASENWAIPVGSDTTGALSAIAWALLAHAHATNRMAIAIESRCDAMRNINGTLMEIARHLSRR